MKKKFSYALVISLILLVFGQNIFACTVFAVGKDATTDNSTITTHNDDSSGADFRLWLIPPMTGETRDIVIDSHNYGDYSNYPEIKDYGNGMKILEIDQKEVTNQYLHSRYSFMNDKGVSMGESTFGINKNTEYGQKVYDLIYGDNTGIIDCWNAQDIALERASSAREAVQIMGDLVEEFGWKDNGETINVCDGDEVWISEFYGKDLWCAVKLPSNAFFVAANRARIDHFDFNDNENYMCSPNFKSFAVENGLWSEKDNVEFKPNKVYAPNSRFYSSRREWRAFDLVAPSLNLDPNAAEFPMWVIPEQKLSVQDIFELTGDYYQGTEFDVTRTAQAGPFGNAAAYDFKERTINLFRTCYVQIANVKSWLPDEVKCLVWFGYGAPDSSYITPVWASMTELPEFYRTGSRFEEFRTDSGWWVNSFVQQTATSNYEEAIVTIHEAREDKMNQQYDVVMELQNTAAWLMRYGHNDAAQQLINNYAYYNAVDWHEDWLTLGNKLYATYMWDKKVMRTPTYPDWWKDILASAPIKPLEK